MAYASAEDGAQIYYETSGNAGDWLVLVSGTGFNSECWKPFQVPYFSKNYRVVVSDHRGLGNSDKPDMPYTTRMFASDIVAVMDELGIEKANVAGHSMGGRVAQWVALDHPQRVQSLVLGATGSGNFANKPDYIRGIPLDTALEIAEQGFQNYLRRHVEGSFFFNPNFSQKEPVKYKLAVESHLANLPPLKSYLRHVIARQMHETSSMISKISARTLVLVGDADRQALGTGNHYEASLFLANRIPHAKLETVPGARHAFFWEKPEESNETMARFLDNPVSRG